MNITFFGAATNVLLEAEVAPSRRAQFEEQYLEVAGEPALVGEFYQLQPNKWGAELRVYFNCATDLSDDFADLDVTVEEGARPYHTTRRYRVNNNAFFWALVAGGYRLGHN